MVSVMHLPPSRPRLAARRAIAACAVPAASIAALLALGGCGSGTHASAREGPQTSCQATVVEDLVHVVKRVYLEGVHSERTIVAERFVGRSAALRRALAQGGAPAAQAAAQALVATGKMTNLRILRPDGSVLADAGGDALAPLRGTLAGSATAPAAGYVASVWSTAGFLAESQGIAEARIALRVHDRSFGGSFALPSGRLPAKGSLTLAGTRYEYASFGGTVFPSGPVRIYVLRTIPSTAAVCGATREETTYKTLSHIAELIYKGEAGKRTQPQVQRVQRNAALLAAVAASDPVATKAAVASLLHEHIVRLRVFSASGRLLVDDGGPYVLAPVTAPLILHGREIGHFVLSIQDDEGYLRLTRRLAGLRVLMYMQSKPEETPQLVKNSLGPNPGSVPASGRFTYGESTFQVYTVHARAFPEGQLTIRVLIPVPYR
jgi:hypothetical protein